MPESLEILSGWHISYAKEWEKLMAQKVRKAEWHNGDRFPPEADGDFPIVPEKEISDWRERLNERFGIGKGRLRPIEEPAAAT